MHARRPFLAALLSASGLLLACGGDDRPATTGAATAADEGFDLARSTGCVNCHQTSDARGTGPGWGGLAGSTVELEGGSTVVADADYLRRSITDPSADVVEGFAPIMPTFDLTPADVDALVAYIESLGEE